MYSFHNFNYLNDNEKKQVLDLRNELYIRKWMFDSQAISWDQHINFFKQLKSDETKMYFFVKRNDFFIGVYSITDIKNYSGQGGFYISLEAANKKLAVEFIFHSIKYIFEYTNIEKIYGLEDVNNKNAFTINRLFGFYDRHKDSIREINGLNYRYGELVNTDFNGIAESPKVDALIKYSQSIIYKFNE
jgi:UDP-4-amino-4,6-dideoxy-N-acetyl-beta-L-altrosamine N-acetyltransferase